MRNIDGTKAAHRLASYRRPMIDIHANAGRSSRRSTPQGDATFELTETAIRHGGEQGGYGPGVGSTQLSLSAGLSGAVRGTVHRPAVFHHRLVLDGWNLTGPEQLPEVWAHQARQALAQLHLRMDGQAHTTPAPGWRWEVSVRHRLRITGAEQVPGQLSPHWPFTPTEMFIDVSTSGAGSMTLVGTGPVETHSKRCLFTVGVGGVVAFDQLDSDDRVPTWAEGPALDAVRLAFELLAAADRRLTIARSTEMTDATTRPEASETGDRA